MFRRPDARGLDPDQRLRKWALGAIFEWESDIGDNLTKACEKAEVMVAYVLNGEIPVVAPPLSEMH